MRQLLLLLLLQFTMLQAVGFAAGAAAATALDTDGPLQSTARIIRLLHSVSALWRNSAAGRTTANDEDKSSLTFDQISPDRERSSTQLAASSSTTTTPMRTVAANEDSWE